MAALARYIPGMSTMNVSLPGSLREFVESQVAERGYGSTSEFVRELIRREQERVELRERLLEGATSPVGAEVGPAYFESLRSLLQERRGTGPGTSSR
jgi:antitoxin ParD1/3/4